VWAGWLPLCSLLAILAFGVGFSAMGVVVTFLVSYNAGHITLRVWTLNAGWREGLKIANVLALPVFRRGPDLIARVMAATAGVAVPVAVARIVGGRPAPLAAALGIAVAWTIATAFLPRRADGWRAALVGISAFTLFSILT